MSRIYRQWLDRVQSFTMQESHINALGQYLGGGGKRNNLTAEELDHLREIVKERGDYSPDTRGYDITAEQEDKGLTWLVNQVWTPTGRERKNNPLSPNQVLVLKDFERFEFRGYVTFYRSWRSVVRPVYRVVAGDGSWFDYAVNYNASELMGGIGGNDRMAVLREGTYEQHRKVA